MMVIKAKLKIKPKIVGILSKNVFVGVRICFIYTIILIYFQFIKLDLNLKEKKINYLFILQIFCRDQG